MRKPPLTRIYARIVLAGRFLKMVDIHPLHLILPVSLALMTAFLEGVATWLFLPLSRGVLAMNFDFMRTVPVLGWITKFLTGKIGGRQVAALAVLLCSFLLVTILKNIVRYLSFMTMSLQVRKLSSTLRKKIFSRYILFGKLFFDRANKGYLQNVLLGFSITVAGHLSRLNHFLILLFQVAVYFIILFYISPILAVLSLFILPLFHYSVHIIVNRIKIFSEKQASKVSAINSRVSDMITCMPLVKLYNREEREYHEFSRESDTIRDLEFSIDKRVAIIGPMMDTVIMISLLSLVSLSAWLLVKDDSLDVGKLLVYFYALKRMFTCVSGLNSVRAGFASVIGPAKQIIKIFDDENKFIIRDGHIGFTGIKSAIDVRGLIFSYRKDLKVLQDVTFSVKRDEITALVGSTGSGKTTIINLLMRFYECGPGKIFIDGRDIVEFSAASIRRHIALVSQDVLLFNDTVKNNIAYGVDRNVTEEEIRDVLSKTRLLDFVMSLPEKMETYIGDRGVQLSGGEKQRVSIARALLKNADILILDEATSAMDTGTERLIQEAISEAIVDKTVIVIAHRLSTIRHADKVIVLDNGRVMEQGALQDLLESRGRFYEYWESQRFY
ncbi:MAG: ABC transporter ATP-binding protein [Candidatus Omnitrophota bacterium]